MSWPLRNYDNEKDAAPVAALITSTCTIPVAAEEFARRVETWPKDQPVKRRVAEIDGKVVAYLRVGQFADNPKNAFMLSVLVDKATRKKGAGTALLEEAVEFTKRLNGSALVTIVMEEDKDGNSFAEKRNFKQVAKCFDSYLDLSQYAQSSHTAAKQRAEQSGYRIATLKEFELCEDTRRALYGAFYKADIDTPGIEYYGYTEWEDFDNEVFKLKSFKPESVTVAMKSDEFVGFSNVFKSTASKPGEMFTGFTGVVPEHRGNGLAYAMKVRGINYCIAEGAKRLKTENDTRNAPMLAVNKKLGFVEHPGEIMYVKELEASS